MKTILITSFFLFTFSTFSRAQNSQCVDYLDIETNPDDFYPDEITFGEFTIHQTAIKFGTIYDFRNKTQIYPLTLSKWILLESSENSNIKTYIGTTSFSGKVYFVITDSSNPDVVKKIGSQINGQLKIKDMVFNEHGELRFLNETGHSYQIQKLPSKYSFLPPYRRLKKEHLKRFQLSTMAGAILLGFQLYVVDTPDFFLMMQALGFPFLPLTLGILEKNPFFEDSKNGYLKLIE